MMSNEEIDYKLAAEQLRTGKPLFGKDDALAPMLECILNAALEGEMDVHLSEASRNSGNRRNGKMGSAVFSSANQKNPLPPLSKASRQHVVWCPEKEKGCIVMMHPLIRVGTMGLEPMTSAM